jgi:hypothetical protein
MAYWTVVCLVRFLEKLVEYLSAGASKPCRGRETSEPIAWLVSELQMLQKAFLPTINCFHVDRSIGPFDFGGETPSAKA